MCSCIYIKRTPNPDDNDKPHISIVFAYVDDFVYTGSCKELIRKDIDQFRTIAKTTDPIWDARDLLGLEVTRNRKERTISLSMSKKIRTLYRALIKNYDLKERSRNVPIPLSGFITREEDIEKLPKDKQELLDEDGIKLYMSMIGSLIWIAGIRFDILTSLLYLTTATRGTRRHHLEMAWYCIQYLNRTHYIPLVLGGKDGIEVITHCDSSLGTGPRGRSIIGNMTQLGSRSGAIQATSKCTMYTYISIFEGEMDACSHAFKATNRVTNILKELQHQLCNTVKCYGDNNAVVDFVHGRGVAKGVRHMQLRMWYVREQHLAGNIEFDFIPGKLNPSDHLTKLADGTAHNVFTRAIMGLELLGEMNILETDKFMNEEDKQRVAKSEKEIQERLDGTIV